MSAEQQPAEDGDLLTVDELANLTGLTVRTTRYYAGLGLLPPPERRGRMAYYGPVHRARLDLIRALQEHGFTLAAIEMYLKRLPDDASVEELSLQRAVLTSWAPGERQVLTHAELERRADRTLTATDVEMLVAMGALRVIEPGRLETLPPFDAALQAIDLGLPADSMLLASEVIGRHMDQMTAELTDVLRDRVLKPLRRGPHQRSAIEIEQSMLRLRQLTLESVVAGFQRAADEIISRSLEERSPSE